MTTIEIKVPPTFYDDHRARDLPEEGTSEELRATKTYRLVRMDYAAFTDLLSDARYYSDPGIAADMGLPGLASSARATVRRLQAEAPEWTALYDEERRAKGWL